MQKLAFFRMACLVEWKSFSFLALTHSALVSFVLSLCVQKSSFSTFRISPLPFFERGRKTRKPVPAFVFKKNLVKRAKKKAKNFLLSSLSCTFSRCAQCVHDWAPERDRPTDPAMSLFPPFSACDIARAQHCNRKGKGGDDF